MRNTMPTRRSADSSHGEQLFETAVEQFDAAADLIGLSDPMRQLLRSPKNEIIVSFPVELDDGELRMFRGYRVQHNDALGPYKGGLRFAPDVELGEVKALAPPNGTLASDAFHAIHIANAFTSPSSTSCANRKPPLKGPRMSLCCTR